MDKKDSNKKIYRLEDEILIELKTVYKLQLRKLNINPETMSIPRIKEKIFKALSKYDKDQIEGLQPILRQLELLTDTSVTKSIPKNTDIEEV